MKTKRELSIPEDFGNLEGLYIPIKKKSYADQTNRERIRYAKYMMRLERFTGRYEVPVSKINKIELLVFDSAKLLQIEKDKEELTFEEFYKKYADHSIIIEIGV